MEQEITREAAQSLVDQIEAVLGSATEHATVHLRDTVLDLTRLPDGSLEFRPAGGVGGVRFYGRPAEAPANYPEGFPFIPEKAFSVTRSPRELGVAWWAPDDPDALYRQLDRQLRAGGWQASRTSEAPEHGVRSTEYALAGVSRHLLVSPAIVSLVERAR